MMQTIERNETFELAYRFVTETNENIFLTGKAGTGKTTFLKYLQNNCTKNILVAAPTGVAAINAGGVTLHSLFQLPFHPFFPTKKSAADLIAKTRITRQRQLILRKMELLVIDEISMVRADVMDAIDAILKSVRRNYEEPFGGVQLLCIGDLHQLPPVAQNHEWALLQEYYASPFFFDSLAVKAQTPLLIELTTIYRQKEDFFVSLLNKVRTNSMTADDFEDLHQRYQPDIDAKDHDRYITLTSHNKQADDINQQQLNKLHTSIFSFKAEIEGEFSENAYPAEANLVLKEGAQVMFLKNDSISKQYFNGKIGTITNLSDDRIVVDCDGTSIDVYKESWDNSRYKLDGDGLLQQETLSVFKQYPLRLAWAITIHKSQGLTFEKIKIDAAAAFSSGQVYVALSRCTSLDGIVLLSKIPAAAIFSNNHVVEGQKNLLHRGSLAERFEGARQVFTNKLLDDIFGFTEITNHCTALLQTLNEHQQKFLPANVEWAQNLAEQFKMLNATGAHFGAKAAALLKEVSVVEEHPMLQQRISDAANWFLPQLETAIHALKNHPLSTEYKEAAAVANEVLHLLLLLLHKQIAQMLYCKAPFSVTGFLQSKLKYVEPKIRVSCYAPHHTQGQTTGSEGELYETLKRWRDSVCKEQDLPVYMVANKATLTEIATLLPLTKKDLMKITGFGKAKVDKYADEILPAVEEYCNRTGEHSNMHLSTKKESSLKVNAVKSVEKQIKIDTKTISYELYRAGKTVDQIAAERNFATSTIEGHLVHFVATGQLNVSDFVNTKDIEQIKTAILIHGKLSHKTIVDNLPGVGYAAIRMVIAATEFNERLT